MDEVKDRVSVLDHLARRLASPSEPARASDWYACVRRARPFHEAKVIPQELQIPRWFPFILGVIALGGAGLGYWDDSEVLPFRLANAAYTAALFTYIVVSALDAHEHFRLEKFVTGRYFGWIVVPIGESILHAAIIGTVIAFTSLARPFAVPFTATDWFLLLAPFLFLAFGWWDELVYHRRRALHREDMLHTVSHLAAGTMIGSLILARMLDWNRITG